ncbi:MAG: hypothetical protein QXE82_00265 [Candidatus Nitrosotenuis sp.]
MATINVRLSDKEKLALEKYGKISDIVREAIHLYINNRKSAEILKKLKEYQQKGRVSTTEEIVSMIREDRDAH